MTNIVVRKVNKYIDVFFGNNGWAKHEWSRFAITYKDGIFAIKHVKGAHVNHAVYAYVKDKAMELV